MMIAVGPGRTSEARIAVVGCGHVGLVMAAGLTHLGHHVVGVDTNAGRVRMLTERGVPFQEPGLAELLHEGLDAGRLHFTTRYEQAIPDADFILLAVDTPAAPSGAADLGNIRAATRSIAANLDSHSPIIINKSTSPIGTGETIETILRSGLADRRVRPRIVANPEFLRQGRAVHDFMHPDRIVVGAHTSADAQAVADLYRKLDAPVIVTDVRTAEMIKYVANSFLATRISFANEMARLCEQLDIDIDQVIEGIALDGRIGPHFFQPGIGFGGSCLPKDVAALRYIGETYGVATPILSAVQEVNQAQRTSAVRKLRRALGTLEGARVAAWGLTFKGGTEDVRNSPAMDVVRLLLNEGAEVRLFDPTAPTQLPDGLTKLLHDDPVDAARGADALAVLTDWPELREVRLMDVRAVMRGSVLFDGRNLLDRDACREAGFEYLGVGRGAKPPLAMAVVA
jgi:UDPglucose 6-dehydrogenase